VPLKAFVDTGAQMTVLSVKGAQKCNLLDKVDSRFRGVAAGVGAARIVGRVHLATLRFGSHTAVDVSLSVLEQSHGPEVRCSF
jgi:DNA damage-inducible protein 1